MSDPNEPKEPKEPGEPGEAREPREPPEAPEAPEPEDAPAAEMESPALKALLKRSLAPETSAAAGEPEGEREAKDKALLLAVQSKLRKRSKGKFYADGWSTTQSRVNYALVAMIMLATIIAVYLALGPTGISR
jgi:hypothetical protein